MKKRIVIYGNGKLAKALAVGLKNSEQYSMLVIGARETSDLSFFEGQGILVTHDVRECMHADCLILAVTPGASGTMFERLEKVERLPETIVSLVSGLAHGVLVSSIAAPGERVIMGTANTNVSGKKGLIALSGKKTWSYRFAESLFQKLGTVIHVNREDVLKFVVAFGSDNGFNAKALLLQLGSCTRDRYQLRFWLEGIRKSLTEWTSYDEDCASIQSHLFAKVQAVKKVLGFSRKDVRKYVHASFLSTIDMLLAKEDAIVEDDMRDLIATVVTPNGCTEKGIDRMDSLEALASQKTMLDIFASVWARALQFPIDVETSM